jgi:general secretion pathway protein K
VVVRAFSAGGQLDLNAAPAESIEKLLLAVGTDKDRAAGLARAIAEFREGGDTLSSGTESKSALYREAGLRHGPKNAAFASVNELEQVLGMDKALFARLRPLVTVHSHRATIDPELAQAILISSGIPIASVSGPASAVQIRVRVSSPLGGAFVREAVFLPASRSPSGFSVRQWVRIDPDQDFPTPQEQSGISCFELLSG